MLLPLHVRIKKLIEELDVDMKNIKIIKSIGYLLISNLISSAYVVIIDSNGLQKEAYFLETSYTTLRNQTEWVEKLENSLNVYVR